MSCLSPLTARALAALPKSNTEPFVCTALNELVTPVPLEPFETENTAVHLCRVELQPLSKVCRQPMNHVGESLFPVGCTLQWKTGWRQ